jgi:hypothetical protein
MLGCAAVVVVGITVRARRSGPKRQPQSLVVTVAREPAALDPLLERLRQDQDLDAVLRPAPGGRGTEIWVSGRQLARPERADVARQALRDVKQVAEAGEVLTAAPTHGRRSRTPAGMLLDAVVARSRTKGVL